MNKLPSRKLWAVLSLIAAGMSASAIAQTPTGTSATGTSTSDTSSDTPVKLEKFTVTGSNIPMAADALAVPVAVVGIPQFERSGVSSDMLDLLRKAAPNISGVGQENAQIATGNNFGGAEVNIKGLGTLVLLNGRRMAFSPAESTGGHQFVDLNLIPVAAVDRVEVLADGASAVYGSDAVGGVINLILKKDYNGWEAGGHYGFTRNTGHYAERSGYLIGGVASGNTSILLGFDYTQHDAIFLKDRPFTNPIYGTRSYPGLIDATDLSTGTDQFYQLNPSLNAPPGGGNQTMDQLVAAGVYTPVTKSQALHVFNLANGETLAGYLKRYSVVGSAEHKIAGDNLVGFLDVVLASTKTWSQLNAQPVVPYVQDPYIDINAMFGFTPPPAGTTYVPLTSPANPFSQSYIDQAGDGSTGNLVFVRNRFINFPRVYANDTKMFHVVGGLRGKIGDNYSWEAAANINRVELNYTNPGVIDTVALQNALNSGTINPWARTQAAGAFNGVIGEAFVDMLSTLHAFDFTFRGTPFELPGGQAGFAVGVQYMREALSAEPDVNSLPNSSGTTQGWSNATTFSNFTAVRNVTSYFAEVEVPITGPRQSIVGLHSLNLDVAGRYDDYSRVGSTTNPKVSLSWQPIDDQLKFRASVGRSFVAPQLYNLFGPVSSGASDAIDYTTINGTKEEQIQFNSSGGANPNLKPATAHNWSTGVVYTPRGLRGFSLTVDYSDIDEKSIPGNIPQATIIQDVETKGTASPYINYVRLNTPTGPTLTGPGQVSSHSPQSIFIVAPLVNLGEQRVKSTDIVVDYFTKIQGIGRLELNTAWTLYNSYRLQVVPTEPLYQYAGQASVNLGTVPKYRAYTTLDWQNSGWDAFVGHSFVSAVDDVTTGGSSASAPVHVASYNQFDLGLSYDFKELHASKWLDGLKVTVGVNNIANRAPPLASGAFPDTNADVGFYNSAVGRMFYINGKYSF